MQSHFKLANSGPSAIDHMTGRIYPVTSVVDGYMDLQKSDKPVRGQLLG